MTEPCKKSYGDYYELRTEFTDYWTEEQMQSWVLHWLDSSGLGRAGAGSKAGLSGLARASAGILLRCIEAACYFHS